jgi:hypothetical protein
MCCPPIFRLSREIRDLIYAYALFEPNGILYQTTRHGSTKLYVADKIFRAQKGVILQSLMRWRRWAWPDTLLAYENNRLKYVCHLFYYETKGLGLQLNCVVFKDFTYMNAAQQCVTLLSNVDQLRTVAILCSPESFATEYGKQNFLKLMDYCNKQPRLLVKIHVPYWSQANPNFVPLGLSYLATLRKDSSMISKLAQTTLVSYLSDSVLHLLTTTIQMPTNFRFFPREERFEPKVFERNCAKSFLVNRNTVTEATGNLTELARSWFNNGI